MGRRNPEAGGSPVTGTVARVTAGVALIRVSAPGAGERAGAGDQRTSQHRAAGDRHTLL
jgi:hypothetical protein